MERFKMKVFYNTYQFAFDIGIAEIFINTIAHIGPPIGFGRGFINDEGKRIVIHEVFRKIPPGSHLHTICAEELFIDSYKLGSNGSIDQAITFCNQWCAIAIQQAPGRNAR